MNLYPQRKPQTASSPHPSANVENAIELMTLLKDVETIQATLSHLQDSYQITLTDFVNYFIQHPKKIGQFETLLSLFNSEEKLHKYLTPLLVTFEQQMQRYYPNNALDNNVVNAIIAHSSLPLLLTKLSHQFGDSLSQNNLYICIARAVMLEIRATRLNYPNYQTFEAEYSHWDKHISLFSEIADCFRKEKISLNYFTDCIAGLDPYINNISAINEEELKTIRRERIRTMLFIFHQKLSLRATPERPSLSNSSLEAEVEQNERALNLWSNCIQEIEEENQKILKLFFDPTHKKSYVLFCMLLKSLVTALLPLTYDKTNPKDALIFEKVTIMNSWIQVFYLNSDVFQNYLSSYLEEEAEKTREPVSVEFILAQVNPRKGIIQIPFIEDSKWNITSLERTFSENIYELLTTENIEKFNEFLDRELLSDLQEVSSSQIYAFCFILNDYFAEKQIVSLLDFSISPEEKARMSKKNDEIELINTKKARVLFKILSTEHESTCERLAIIVNKMRTNSLPSVQIPKIFSTLSERSQRFKDTLEQAQEGTLGYTLRNKTRSDSNLSTSLSSLSLNISSDSLSLPSPGRHSVFRKTSSGSPTTTISSKSSDVLSLSPVININPRPATDELIVCLGETLFAIVNISSKAQEIPALQSILQALNAQEINAEQVVQILSKIESQLCQLNTKEKMTSQDLRCSSFGSISPPKSKKKYPLFSMLFQGSPRSISTEEKRDIQQRIKSVDELVLSTNQARKDTVDLLLKDEGIGSELACLIRKIPDFSPAELQEILIEDKYFTETVFEEFAASNPTFQQQLGIPSTNTFCV